jgi:hypothetical protein
LFVFFASAGEDSLIFLHCSTEAGEDTTHEKQAKYRSLPWIVFIVPDAETVLGAVEAIPFA